ncbi:transporter substrate-binding domain-containing protein [Microbacterium sp. P26]|uniref:substrate-binding periplasmic protein n=1 Tax=Microbacterium TaxID=33882 RepID=UPI00203B721C|nr:ABC transporter substrate-binding protein [Microbacterium sp. P26]MCM3501170.1 transporter substrate-binding domain-containing protein [Microbacterium sp. P26]
MTTSTPIRWTAGILLAAAAVVLSACASGATAETGESDSGYELVTDGTLSVATISDGSPNAYIDADGEFTGFDNELVREIASRMDLDVQFTATDFSSLLASVNNGQYDVGSAGVTVTDARKQTSSFTAPHYFAFLGIVAPSGSDYASFEDLEGKQVVVAAGSVQEEYAVSELGLDPIRFPDQTSAFQALLAGQGDAWLAPFGTGTKYLDEYPDSDMEMVYSQLNSRNQLGFAVAKENTGLVDAMNEQLDAIVEDGTWYELVQEFYPGAEIPADFTPGTADVTFERP